MRMLNGQEVMFLQEQIEDGIVERAIVFEKIDFTPGSLFVYKITSVDPIQKVGPEVEYIQELVDQHDCEVMVLPHYISLDVVSEKEMKKVGWIRDPEFKPERKYDLNSLNRLNRLNRLKKLT